MSFPAEQDAQPSEARHVYALNTAFEWSDLAEFPTDEAPETEPVVLSPEQESALQALTEFGGEMGVDPAFLGSGQAPLHRLWREQVRSSDFRLEFADRVVLLKWDAPRVEPSMAVFAAFLFSMFCEQVFDG